MPDIHPDGGAFRWNDPNTSRDAAKSINVSRLRLLIMRYLRPLQEPRNGWEMSKGLDLPTITVVPRLCRLRREGLIILVGKRPGPTLRGQRAYVLSAKGHYILSCLARKDDNKDSV